MSLSEQQLVDCDHEVIIYRSMLHIVANLTKSYTLHISGLTSLMLY